MTITNGFRLQIFRIILAFAICLSSNGRAFAAGNSPSTIDITQYRETFSDDFRHGLNVTAWGPSKWIAHTPWHGDFGDAQFIDPRPGYPFATTGDGLMIVAEKNLEGKWQSGLLSSSDARDRGFTQKGGYFEARMKFPPSAGVWPAFWLRSIGDPSGSAEIDIVEYYGQFNDSYHATVHHWPHNGVGQQTGAGQKIDVPAASLVRGFHTYGAEILQSEIVIYLDRQEVWRTPAPAGSEQALSILLDLGLGGGWPIKDTFSPSIMEVDYVKAFQRK